MNEKVNLKKASSFYFIGTLFNKGIVFLTVPIFTRILSVSEYGILTTYNSWVSIISIFMSLALYMGVRASFVDYKEKTNDFLSSILCFVGIYGLLISLIIVILMYLIPINVEISLVVLCLIQSLSTAFIEIVSMYLMMNYKYKLRTMFMVLPNLISIIIAIVLIQFFLSNKLYFGRIIPTTIVTFFFGLIALYYGLRNAKLGINKEYLTYGLKISIPLVFHGLALAILSQSDRTMITIIRDSEETGIYGLIYNFSMIATVITTAFDGIWIPYFTNRMNICDYEKINKMSKKYLKLMTVAMIAVILLGPEIVKILASKPYWSGITIIPPIVLSNYLIFIYTLYVNVEHYHKKTIFISINTVVAAVANIILNVFFINFWGYIGAAYSTFLSYGLSLVLHYKYSKRLNDKLFPIQMMIAPMVELLITIISFYIFLDVWYLRWILLIFLFIATLVSEKEMILFIFRKNTR